MAQENQFRMTIMRIASRLSFPVPGLSIFAMTADFWEKDALN